MLVALVASLSAYERWASSHGSSLHNLAWGFGFLLISVASGFMAAGAKLGWNQTIFRGFYLFGAVVDVPVLALGSAYLLFGKEVGRWLSRLVAAFCFYSAGIVTTTRFTHTLHPSQLPQGSQVFSALPRVLAAVGSGLGASFIFVASAIGIVKSLRSRPRKGRLAATNLLISVGVAIMGMSGALNSVFGAMSAFSVTLTIGIIVIYSGFLVGTAAPRNTVLLSEETVIKLSA